MSDIMEIRQNTASPITELDIQSHIQSAFAAHQQGVWGEAFEGYRTVLVFDPIQLDALQLIAVLNGQRGVPQNAIPFFERAVLIAPKNFELRNNYARALHDFGAWERALQEYGALRQARPESPEILLSWAECQKNMGHTEAAVEGCQRAAVIDPQHHPAYATLANLQRGYQRYSKGLNALKRAARLAPSETSYRLNLALFLSERGAHEEASAEIRFLACHAPNVPLVWYFDGLIAQNLGSGRHASQSFGRAIHQDPLSVDARVQWAALLNGAGFYDDAWRLAKAALIVEPFCVAALQALIIARCASQKAHPQSLDQQLRRVIAVDHSSVAVMVGAAVNHYQRKASEVWLHLLNLLLEIAPYSSEANAHQGIVLNDCQRFDLALQAFNRALVLVPQLVNPQVNRVQSLVSLGRLDEALIGINRAILLDQSVVEAYLSKGMVLGELRRMTEALDAFSAAVDLSKASSVAYLNRGSCLQKQGEVERSFVDIRTAIVLDPSVAEPYNVLGLLLQADHDFEQSMRSLERALNLNPHLADAQLNKGLLQLMLGNFREGSLGFEWRWQGPMKGVAPQFSQPLWLGKESLKGKVILVSAEQGFGDAIQYARYFPMLSKISKRVVAEVPSSLIPLFSECQEDIEWVAQGNPLPAFDFYCPVMSLDLAFRTELSSIPNKIPYLQVPANALIRWKNRIIRGRRKRIGLVWKGNPHHLNDHNRSMPFDVAKTILGVEGFEFHVLQQHLTSEEKHALRAMPEILVHSTEIRDFADTAAIVAAMDLVIAVDTSVAHLAGALGVPVWLMLAHVPDHRWLLQREDTPWYPTARLFRQDYRKDWIGLGQKIIGALGPALGQE